jgi:hypothetical protein
MIVPGGGLSLDGERFVPCRGRRRRFFLPVRVLSRLFRRLVLEKLAAAHGKGLLTFQGSLAYLSPAAAVPRCSNRCAIRKRRRVPVRRLQS